MKRRMCMFAISALMVMALGAFAQAQEGQGGGRRGPMMSPEDRVNRLSDLNLTDDQKTKIKAIYQEQADKIQKMREDTSLSQDDRRSKMMEMNKDSNEKIKAILDKDQQKKFDEMQERMRPRGPGGPGGAKPPEGGQKPPSQ